MIRKLTFTNALKGERLNRGFVWGMLIIAALAAFELFNFSTTEFAMSDLLGDLRFAGIRWATILAIAFCGIDFAGIARLFTPETGDEKPGEVWYLFGAWLLAATMNAMLTWWGVSIAIANHATLGSAVLPRETLLTAAPVFVAVMVWLIRVLIIGTFSVAGERLFSQGNGPMPLQRKPTSMARKPSGNGATPQANPALGFRPAPKNMARPRQSPQPARMASKQSHLHAYRDSQR